MKKQNKNISFLARSVAQRRPRCPSSPRYSPTARPRYRGCGSFRKIYFCFVFLFSIFYFLFAISAIAQLGLPTNRLPNLNLAPALSLSTDPATPLPNSAVTVTANLSGITNVNNSTYTWFINGAKKADSSGLNKNVLLFPTGPLGTVYRVSVTIIMPNGENLSDAVSFTVSDFDITWDSNNGAPAGYRGKILPTTNSIITVSALPFVYSPGAKNLLGPGNLIFNWSINDKFKADKSGVNKSELSFLVDKFPGDSVVVGLEIRTENKAVSLNKSVVIPVARPQVFIYFTDNKTGLPLGGTIRDLIISPAVKSLSFAAETYFFNYPANQLKWNWLVDNKNISGGGDKPWTAVLNVPSGVNLPFSTRIQATAQNPQNELERAQSTVNLEIR